MKMEEKYFKSKKNYKMVYIIIIIAATFLWETIDLKRKVESESVVFKNYWWTLVIIEIILVIIILYCGHKLLIPIN